MLAIIPPLNHYLHKLARLSKIWVYPATPYPKSLHLNSFLLPSANGYQRLSLPLQGGRSSMRSLADTQIDYSLSWLKLHRKTLDSCYRNSPWYVWYIDDFWQIYAQRQRFLLDKIIVLYSYLTALLGQRVEISFAYQRRMPRVLNLGLEIPAYPQVFAHKLGFLPRVSLLDLLFHLGPEAREYLKGFRMQLTT